jgi:phage-related protein
VEKCLEALEANERALLLDAIEELGQYGLQSGRVRTRQIENKLWEIKVTRHRVFYVTIAGPTMVLLHAYKKQGQKAPK